MILRKPYGFLIRNFKVIHFALLVIYIYLAIKVNGILNYYSDFISNTVSKLDAIKYVNNNYLIAVILSMVICVIVYMLMRYKKKPRLLYLLLIGFYIIVTVMVNVSYGGLQSIYVSSLDLKTLRLYRDLLRIIVLFQYISIAFVLVRALGFDIKKFNFVQDLQDLNIDVSDEEEVELTFGSTNSLRRNAHRGLREFKYYYFENRVFINIIIVVVIIALFGGLYVDKEVINKEYSENEVFSSDKYNFNVLSSYVTDRDYNNVVISGDGSSYVIIKLGINSKVGKNVFNRANLILKIGNSTYAPDVRLASKFVDLGTVYTGEVFDGTATYLFVYNVSNYDENTKMKLIYAGDKVVNLSPVYLDKTSDKNSYKIGDSIDLTKSSFGYGYLKISSYDIKKEFSYNYDYDVKGKTYTGTIKINSEYNVIMNLIIDSEYVSGFSNYDILSKYSVLKYKIGDKEYSSSVFSDKTPGTYNKGLYLVVDKEILSASSIWFEINIRNQQFIYTLK